MSIEIKNFFYSKIHDTILLTPMKTASTHASWVLRYFDFNFYTASGNFIFMNDWLCQSHDCFIPDTYKNSKTILTVRNPYTRLVSFFLHRFSPYKGNNPTIEDFEIFLTDVENNVNLYNQLNHGFEIEATYFIRAEYLYNDYCRIPFISESDFNNSGMLKKFCEKKLNQNKFLFDNDIFLNEKNKKKIYEMFEWKFKKFNYPE